MSPNRSASWSSMAKRRARTGSLNLCLDYAVSPWPAGVPSGKQWIRWSAAEYFCAAGPPKLILQPIDRDLHSHAPQKPPVPRAREGRPARLIHAAPTGSGSRAAVARSLRVLSATWRARPRIG
eukprot:3838928-Pleurochrysis_carterae.AAC.1